MTIGEKIKLCRKNRKITQAQLASITGIHHVSIRKYETNKMEPQLTQLKRIASALDVSIHAFIGFDSFSQSNITPVQSLMHLLNAGMISLTGQRNENHLLIEDTVTVQVNPLLSDMISVSLSTKEDKAFSLLLEWECLSHKLKALAESKSESENESLIQQIREDMEQLVIEILILS